MAQVNPASAEIPGQDPSTQFAKEAAEISTGNVELYNKLVKVENLVAEALGCTNGACADGATAAVEASVRRARTKGRMLSMLGNDLVLAALDVRIY